jgi:hypothetical protein
MQWLQCSSIVTATILSSINNEPQPLRMRWQGTRISNNNTRVLWMYVLNDIILTVDVSQREFVVTGSKIEGSFIKNPESKKKNLQSRFYHMHQHPPFRMSNVCLEQCSGTRIHAFDDRGCGCQSQLVFGPYKFVTAKKESVSESEFFLGRARSWIL